MNQMGNWLATAAFSLVLSTTSAIAATQSLGSQQFADGDSPIYVSDFLGVPSDSDYDAFNQWSGMDARWVDPATATSTGNWGWVWNASAGYYEWQDASGAYHLDGSLGHLSYSHALDLNGAVGPATIEFGLFDADFGSNNLAADEMISIMLNGVSFTPSGDWLPVQTGISSYHVVSFDIDLSWFDPEGTLDIDIWAIGHGTCVATPIDSERNAPAVDPTCQGNGIGIDYSTLTVQTVPVPASGLLLLGGIAALAAKRRRKG